MNWEPFCNEKKINAKTSHTERIYSVEYITLIFHSGNIFPVCRVRVMHVYGLYWHWWPTTHYSIFFFVSNSLLYICLAKAKHCELFSKLTERNSSTLSWSKFLHVRAHNGRFWHTNLWTTYDSVYIDFIIFYETYALFSPV